MVIIITKLINNHHYSHNNQFHCSTFITNSTIILLSINTTNNHFYISSMLHILSFSFRIPCILFHILFIILYDVCVVFHLVILYLNLSMPFKGMLIYFCFTITCQYYSSFIVTILFLMYYQRLFNFLIGVLIGLQQLVIQYFIIHLYCFMVVYYLIIQQNQLLIYFYLFNSLMLFTFYLKLQFCYQRFYYPKMLFCCLRKLFYSQLKLFYYLNQLITFQQILSYLKKRSYQFAMVSIFILTFQMLFCCFHLVIKMEIPLKHFLVPHLKAIYLLLHHHFLKLLLLLLNHFLLQVVTLFQISLLLLVFLLIYLLSLKSCKFTIIAWFQMSMKQTLQEVKQEVDLVQAKELVNFQVQQDQDYYSMLF